MVPAVKIQQPVAARIFKRQNFSNCLPRHTEPCACTSSRTVARLMTIARDSQRDLTVDDQKRVGRADEFDSAPIGAASSLHVAEGLRSSDDETAWND